MVFLVVLYKDPPGSPQAQRKDAQLQNLAKLEKQLAIEQRVKSAAENMILMYSNSKSRQDRNRLTEAQQLLSDSKTKVEVLRMKIMKIKAVANSQQQSPSDRGLESSGGASESGGAGGDGSQNNVGRPKATSLQTPEGRINILNYRIDVERRLMKGAASIMMVANPNDKKSGQTVSGIMEVFL